MTTPTTDEGRSRTHLMFSHTAKGQAYNLPLLSRFATGQTADAAPARLIDYELLTDGPGREAKRVVGFGWFAGGSWSAYLEKKAYDYCCPDHADYF